MKYLKILVLVFLLLISLIIVIFYTLIPLDERITIRSVATYGDVYQDDNRFFGTLGEIRVANEHAVARVYNPPSFIGCLDTDDYYSRDITVWVSPTEDYSQKYRYDDQDFRFDLEPSSTTTYYVLGEVSRYTINNLENPVNSITLYRLKDQDVGFPLWDSYYRSSRCSSISDYDIAEEYTISLIPTQGI